MMMVRIPTIASQPLEIYTRTGSELEPRQPRDEVSDLYINIGATLEDHGEVS